ncbi:hypothetical protein HJC23_007413 [Cyclotella cryptica]|uniref:Uncharacterized protein n=1 Tax=Cyclotella cryptica TaxID=29204 RepID=A0ABD3QHN6_9STRA|eukprot:CCRYP_005154-RA/>CCRYP_005154-RA protein AED:0.03 eAED:0.01 QI:0/-1/0/1/-1/1/1/0/424
MLATSIQRFATPILLSNVLTTWVHTFTPLPILRPHPILPSLSPTPLHSKIIDAEFTHNNDDNNNSNGHDAITKSNNNEISLIEYSQNQDPDWKSMPIAFCDMETNTYIDCTLAFYVRDNKNGGEEYALGVPCEIPIVVALEVEQDDNDDDDDNDALSLTNLARVLPINPDSTENTPNEGYYKIGEDEKKEIFEIAARALSEEFGKEVRLKKTPRVLTVQGDLDGIIGDWKEVLVGACNPRAKKMNRPDIEEALKMLDEEEEEGERYFDMIMRRDLGEDYMKLVEEEDEDEEIDEDILKMFDVNVEDLQDGDLEEFLKFLGENETEGDDIDETKSYDELLKQLKPSAALRLLSFIGPDEKEYTILRPLRPILLVGKEDPEDYTRRILLSEDEQRAILPKLERVCKEELEQAGFFLTGASNDNKMS